MLEYQNAAVAELADAIDSKSIEGNLMGVRLSPAAPRRKSQCRAPPQAGLGDQFAGGFLAAAGGEMHSNYFKNGAQRYIHFYLFATHWNVIMHAWNCHL